VKQEDQKKKLDRIIASDFNAAARASAGVFRPRCPVCEDDKTIAVLYFSEDFDEEFLKTEKCPFHK
jgi:hypothetical protein